MTVGDGRITSLYGSTLECLHVGCGCGMGFLFFGMSEACIYRCFLSDQGLTKRSSFHNGSGSSCVRPTKRSERRTKEKVVRRVRDSGLDC